MADALVCHLRNPGIIGGEIIKSPPITCICGLGVGQGIAPPLAVKVGQHLSRLYTRIVTKLVGVEGPMNWPMAVSGRLEYSPQIPSSCQPATCGSHFTGL